MKNKRKICILVGIIGIIVVMSVKYKVDINRNEDSIAIIGGADGPTSVFLAGKLSNEGDQMTEYMSIPMDMAKELFEQEGDYIILDVRRADEFEEGHIPGAINLANEDIGTSEIKEFPDKEQTIYVYCRSGNRSKQAAEKLCALGYQDIIEIGGIQDWSGEIVQGKE